MLGTLAKRRPLIVVGTLALLLLLLGSAPGLRTEPANAGPPADPAMALNIKGGDCDNAASPTECDVPVGSSFTLSVEVGPIPIEGYVLMQLYIDYGEYFPSRTEDPDAVDDPLTTDFVEGPGPCDDGIDNGGDIIFNGSIVKVINHDRFDQDCVESDLEYKPTVDASEEIIWPDCEPQTAVRSQLGPTMISLGCLTDLSLPLFLSTYTGNAVEMAFTCSTSVSTSEVRLLPEGHPIPGTSGALFVTSSGSRIVPVLSNLTVNCVEPAPVGGISLDSDLRLLPLATNSTGGSPWGVAFKFVAAVCLVAVGATWYARKRWLT